MERETAHPTVRLWPPCRSLPPRALSSPRSSRSANSPSSSTSVFGLCDQLLELIFERFGRGQALERFDLTFDVGDSVTDERGGLRVGRARSSAPPCPPTASSSSTFAMFRFAVRPADLVGVVRPFGPTGSAPRPLPLRRPHPSAACRRPSPRVPPPVLAAASRSPRPGRSPLRVRGRSPVSNASASFSSSCAVRSSPTVDPDRLRFVRPAPAAARGFPLTSVFDARHGAADQLGGFFADLRVRQAHLPPAPRIRFRARRSLRGRRCRSRRPCETHSVWDSRAFFAPRRSRSSSHRRIPPPAQRPAKAPTSDDSKAHPKSPPLSLFRSGSFFPFAKPRESTDPRCATDPEAARFGGRRPSGTGALPHRCGGYAGRRLEARPSRLGKEHREGLRARS